LAEAHQGSKQPFLPRPKQEQAVRLDVVRSRNQLFRVARLEEAASQ
jgi:hypothetical protein